MRSTRSITLTCLTTAALLGATVTANAAPLREPLSQSAITIELSAAPGGAPTRALLTGPDGYRSELTTSTVLRGLAPGTYTLTGESSSGRLGEVVPQPAMSTVTVGFADTVALGINYFPAKPAASGQGAAGDYALQTLYAGLPVRWNPCTEVTWAMSADSAAEEHERMAAAFDTASLATGLTFREVTAGEQAAVAVQLRSVPGDRVKGEGEMQFRSGGAQRELPYAGSIQADIGTETSADLRTAIYLHEIGHVLGITHVAAEAEVMHEIVDEADATGYKAGDLAGLAQVGMAAGCLNRPTPPLDARVRTLGKDLAVGWFQPASSDPVQRSWLRLRSAKDTSGIYIDMPLDTDANPTLREGAQYVRIAMPSDVCAPGAAPELVVANRNGSTVTPLSVTGCPTRATSG
ncbi:MAG: matrixin family metalloprotease [Actinobacteria bacterium]|nr:MAG: matrixin family metalloprotease [Actinomycetota bacterium]